MLKFFNTLGREIEEFKPIDDKTVKLYTCGPTVYDSAHIGNLRAYVFSDLLTRTLSSNGYNVKRVMNITDIDDKTIKGSKGVKADFEALIQKYEDKYWLDFHEINNLNPDVVTHATEYVEKMVKFIEVLLEKGLAYKAADGSVYFSIAKFPDYGRLANLDRAGLKPGARVSQDEYDKENPADFVLWKAWDETDGEIFWDPSTWLGASSSLGKGRPGWSIECSVMSTDVLGNTLDIHTGGVDNIFPHHENEIAQSEAKTGVKFVNYWLHNEHLLVDGRKMSKSFNNFYTLDDIKAKGFTGLDFRYLCLQAHYRSKLNFTWEGMEAAKNARNRLQRIASDLGSVENGSINEEYIGQFNLKMANDLDSPGALAVLWDLVRSDKISNGDKLATIAEMDKTLGLNLLKNEESIELTDEQKALIKEREQSRKDGDFAKSDSIRKKLVEMGINIEDTKDGTKIIG